MKKFIAHLIKFKTTYIVTFIISSAIGVGIFLAYYFVQNKSLIAELNGTGVAGAVLIGVGALCYVARLGAFDTFSYGFTQMFSSWFGKKANKYNDMNEYKNDKNQKRIASSKYYLVMMLVGLVFMIAFIALEIYKSTLK